MKSNLNSLKGCRMSAYLGFQISCNEWSMRHRREFGELAPGRLWTSSGSCNYGRLARTRRRQIRRRKIYPFQIESSPRFSLPRPFLELEPMIIATGHPRKSSQLHCHRPQCLLSSSRHQVVFGPLFLFSLSNNYRTRPSQAYVRI